MVARTDIETLILEYRLTSCLQCGKCTASCPLSEIFGDATYGHTPRGIIQKALLGTDIVTSEIIWNCLTCDVCTVGCPSGVRFRDFIEALRRLALAEGHDAHAVRCKRCDKYFAPSCVHEHLITQLMGADGPPEFLSLCPPCRAVVFSERVKESLPAGLRVRRAKGSS